MCVCVLESEREGRREGDGTRLPPTDSPSPSMTPSEPRATSSQVDYGPFLEARISPSECPAWL